jgi:predicted MFS family arabinose efflux permease
MTLIASLGYALSGPAWNALAPELVPRSQLEAAVALGTAGLNVARGLGAALGGVLVQACGPGWVFILNAVSMIAFMIALLRWQQQRQDQDPTNNAPAERMVGAMKAGLRYARHSVPLHAVLIRTGIFVSASSAIWALLPLAARQLYHLSAIEYGFILSLFGFGTLAGASAVPRLRQSASQDQLLGAGSLLCAFCLTSLSCANSFPLAALAMFAGGIGWITACAALNSSLLSATPGWVRARVVAIYLMIFQGCLAAGSLIWGVTATYLGMQMALAIAAGVLVIGLLAAPKFSLAPAERVDLRSSNHWAKPLINAQPHPERGPVMITVEYLIDPNRTQDFTSAMAKMESQRRRDGAYKWHLFCDLAGSGRYVETFFVETWGEYLRQRKRATVDDCKIEERVADFHLGSERPQISHLIAERRTGANEAD